MKVVFVDFEFDYGNASRGINEISEYGFRRPLPKLGHEFLPFFYDKYLDNLPQLQIDLLQFVERHKPDLVFFVLHADEIHVETIRRISQLCKTVNWFGDDTWRFADFSSRYASAFTHVITTDPFAVPKYKALGVRNVFLSQWAALELELSEQPLEYKYDVSFIGMANAVRRWWVRELEKKGIHVETFGFGWPNGKCSVEDVVRIFRQSRINLNFSNSRTLDLRFLASSPRSIANAWLNPKVESQIKARCFEIPYAGGFQLCDYTPFLDRYFDIGKEVVCYSTLEDAASLIRYYLANESERQEIAARGTDRARREHTYTHRLKAVMDWI